MKMALLTGRPQYQHYVSEWDGALQYVGSRSSMMSDE